MRWVAILWLMTVVVCHGFTPDLFETCENKVYDSRLTKELVDETNLRYRWNNQTPLLITKNIRAPIYGGCVHGGVTLTWSWTANRFLGSVSPPHEWAGVLYNAYIIDNSRIDIVYSGQNDGPWTIIATNDPPWYVRDFTYVQPARYQTNNTVSVSDLEGMSYAIESIIPSFVLPYYSSGDDFCFDDWFSYTGLDHWPGDRYPLAEMFDKNPACGIVVMGKGSNTTVGATHNGVGEVWERYINVSTDPELTTNRVDLPTGRWIKRLNRPNPLVVAEWGNPTWEYYADDYGYALVYYENDGQSQFWRTNAWEYYNGFGNEFADELMMTPGLPFERCLLGEFDGRSMIYNQPKPYFIVNPGGSNSYTGGLFLKQGQATNFWNYPPWDYPNYVNGKLAEFVASPSNCVVLYTNMARWSSKTIQINSATQQADEAWLALNIPLALDGTFPNSRWVTNDVWPAIQRWSGTAANHWRFYSSNTWFDLATNNWMGVTLEQPYKEIRQVSSATVALKYLDPMTTYSGSRVWDSTLFPEQLKAHYTALTNMFLVPWTQLSWTNQLAVTGSTDYITFGSWPDDLSWRHSNRISTFSFTSNFVAHSDTSEPPEPVDPWQWGGYPWLSALTLPALDHGDIYPIDSGSAPKFDFSCSGESEVSQEWEAKINWEDDMPGNEIWWFTNSPPPNRDWNCKLKIDVAGNGYVWGTGIDACLRINGLYTGTPHRVHIYEKRNYTNNNVRSTFYRSHLSDWSSESFYVSPYYSVWSNLQDIVLAPGEHFESDVLSPSEMPPDWGVGWTITNIPYSEYITTNYVIGWEDTLYDTTVEAVELIECANPTQFRQWTNEWYMRSPVWTNVVLSATNKMIEVYSGNMYGIEYPHDGQTENSESIPLPDSEITASTNTGGTVYYFDYIPSCGSTQTVAMSTSNFVIMAESHSGNSSQYSYPKLFETINGVEWDWSGNLESPSGSWVDGNGVSWETWTPIYSGYTLHTGWLYELQNDQMRASTSFSFQAQIQDIKVLVEWQH